MNTKAVVILDSISEQELNKIDLIDQPDIFVYPRECIEELATNYAIHALELSDEEKRKVNYETFDKITSFSSIEIQGEKLLHLLSADSFFHTWYYHRFRIYFAVRNLLYQIKSIENILQSYEGCLIYSNNASVRHYFKNTPNVSFIATNKTGNRLKVNKGAIFRYIGKGFNHALFKSSAKRKVLRKTHLVVTTEKQYEVRKDTPYYFNKFYGNIFQHPEFEDFGIFNITALPDFKIKSTASTAKNRSQRKALHSELHSESVFVTSGALRLSHWRKVRNFSKKLQAVYLKVDSLSDFTHRLMVLELKSLHLSSTLFYLTYLSYRRMLKNASIKSITAIDENGTNTKLLLDAAKNFDIPSVGIQHGTIHELHPNYMYSKADIHYNAPSDYTLLWGDHYKQLLMNHGNYRSNGLHVIGQLRMDSIFLGENGKESTLSQTLKDTTKEIVMFASQPQRDESLRHQAALHFLTACKAGNDILSVIKIHPNEHKEYYQEIARETGTAPIILGKETDLFELIRRSSVVVTCFSTVGSEAVCLRKPLVIIDPLEQDLMGYISSGVAIKATSQETLQESLEKLISGELKISEESVDKFIDQYAHKVDGKTTERYFSFIKKTFE